MSAHRSLLCAAQFSRLAVGNACVSLCWESSRPCRFRACMSTRGIPRTSVSRRNAATAVCRNTFRLSGLGDDEDLPERREALKEARRKAGSQYDTPLLSLVERLHKEHSERCVLVRVGDFYELHLDHASHYGKKLGLNVTKKKYGSHSVPFTGFPAKQLERYLETLVRNHGISVALAEQVRGQNEGYDRRVVRVVTPATFLAEDDSPFGLYLLAVDIGPSSSRDLGFAWVDLSTGHFYSQQVAESAVEATLARIRPTEVLASDDVEAVKDHAFHLAMKRLQRFPLHIRPTIAHMSSRDLANLIRWSTKHSPDYLRGGRPHDLANEVEATSALYKASDRDTPEFRAAILLLSFLRDTQMENTPRLRWPPEKFDASETMAIDRSTIQSLELVRSLQDNSIKGSLLHGINKTKTRQGAKLLARWLLAPLKSLDRISRRVSVVNFFYADKRMRDDSQNFLQQTPDASLSVQRVNLNSARLDDLQRIVTALSCAEQIRGIMERAIEDKKKRGEEIPGAVMEVIERLDTNDRLRKRIEKSVAVGPAADDEGDVCAEGSVEIVEANAGNWRMKCDASEDLRRLHMARVELEKKKDRMEDQLEAEGPALDNPKSKSPSPVRKTWSGVRLVLPIGRDEACLELRKGSLDLPPLRQKYVAKRYRYEPWTKLAYEISDNRVSISQAEEVLMEELYKLVRDQCHALNSTFDALWEIDVTCALAALANERKYVKPVLDESTVTDIRGGRHPVVENHLAEKCFTFVKNNTFLGGDQRLWLLTGPNMGGKSTFLRQTALITLLAQIGSYVPADEARLGIVDAMFSRVGGADNLAQNQSTFMVEMQETANILKNATNKSLVIMDEVGRGTATEEGCSIAFATIEHLLEVNRCRAIFATHFREIPRMLTCPTSGKAGDKAKAILVGDGANVKCYRCAVIKQGEDSMTMTFRIEPGISEEACALHVAADAGIPHSVCQRARELKDVLGAGVGRDANAIISSTGLDHLGRLNPAMAEPSQLANWACSHLDEAQLIQLIAHIKEYLLSLTNLDRLQNVDAAGLDQFAKSVGGSLDETMSRELLEQFRERLVFMNLNHPAYLDAAGVDRLQFVKRASGHLSRAELMELLKQIIENQAESADLLRVAKWACAHLDEIKFIDLVNHITKARLEKKGTRTRPGEE